MDILKIELGFSMICVRSTIHVLGGLSVLFIVLSR